MISLLLSLSGTAVTMTLLIILLLILSRTFGRRFRASSRRIIWALVMIRLCIPVSGLLPKLITFELPESLNLSAPESNAGLTVNTMTESIPPQPITTAAPTISDTAADSFIESSATAPRENISGAIESVAVESTAAQTASTAPKAVETTLPTIKPVLDSATSVTEPSDTVGRIESSPKPILQLDFDLLAKPIIVVWLCGSLAFGAALIFGSMRVNAKLTEKLSEPSDSLRFKYIELCGEMKLRRTPALFISESAKSPLLCGFFSPMVLIPAEIPVGEDFISPILAHELTHYRRGDLWLNLIAAAAKSLWWWNPLVHIAAKKLSDEIELSCDEKVLEGVSDSARLNYGGAMLEVVRSFKPGKTKAGLTTQYSPSGKTVKARLDNILDPTKKRRGYILVALTLIACIFAGCFVGCRLTKPQIIASDDDEILRTAASDGFTYNVYNNHIGISAVDGAIPSKLVIPEKLEDLPVARLEADFLRDSLSGIDEIILPDTLVYIGDGALSSEGWDGRLSIPKSVVHIGKEALDGITFDADSNGFVIVGSGVLIRYTGSGGNISLPASVRTVGSAFCNNENVASVKVNNGCTELSASAFAFSNITEVTLPDSVEVIGRDCFRGSKLENIRMPDGKCSIGKFAFETAQTGSRLRMTVCDKSDALLWAVENDITFMIEKSDGTLHGADYLEAVGAGRHEFTKDGENIELTVEEKFMTADKSRAIILLDENSDRMVDHICFVNLRTMRVTDDFTLDKNELMTILDGYPTEKRDYSDCALTGELTPVGWSGDVFTLSGELSIRHDEDEWYIIALFGYIPGSGYLSLESIHTDALLPNYLAGYVELTATPDGSAKLYGKPDESSGFKSPMIIRWTFGSINLDSDSFTQNSKPQLIQRDMNGDKQNDLVLFWYENGAGAAAANMCAEVFYGPTGAKKSCINPLADFESYAKIESSDGGWALRTEFGDYELSTQKFSPDDELIVGNYTECIAAGSYLIATLSQKSGMSGENEQICMVYSYSDGEFVPVSIFPTLRSVPVLSDDSSSLWALGENKFLLISNGVQTEFLTDESAPSDFRLTHSDFDGDGIQDAVLIAAAETDSGIHTEQIFILTSADGKLRKIDLYSDLDELFGITGSDSGWHYSSRFGEFDIYKSEFDGRESELGSVPSLTTDFRFSVSGDAISCDIRVNCGSAEPIFSGTSLRLTYRLDSFFRVKDVSVIRAGTTELVFDFDSMYSYVMNAEQTTRRNDQITIRLTDRGAPTLNIKFTDGYPTLVSMKAKNQTLTFETPLGMTGNLRFDIFEAGGYLVAESLYYDFGDTYIISDDCIYRNYSDYSEGKKSTDDYLSFSERDGELVYTRTSLRYNSVDLGQYGIYWVLDRITSRDDFWKETGKAELIDGGLVLTPEETFTISDAFDLDSEFRAHHDYVASFNSIDEVIARNLRQLTSSVATTAISTTFENFKSEIAKLMQTGTSKLLVATITDADNAVLTVEKNSSGTMLTKIEARGSLLTPSNLIVFDNSPEITLFAADGMTALQVVHQNGACDRYLFDGSGIYQEHDSAYDANEFTTRWFEKDGRVGFETKSTANMKLILSDLTSRDAYYSKRGYRDSYYGFVITDSQKFSEVYDLDAEYERYRDAFGYPSLDDLIGVNSAMESGYTEFRKLTPDEFLNLQSLPDEPNKKLAFDVGFAVIMAHTDNKGNLFIDRISARGNGMIFAEPIQQTDAVAVKLFEAGEYVVLSASYGLSRTENYIFSRNFGSASVLSENEGNIDDTLIYLSERGGQLAYTKIAARYAYTEAFIGIANITGRDDFYKEEGYVTMSNGDLQFHPDKTYTLSEIFDLDAEFEKYRDVYFKDFDTLDKAIAYNRRHLLPPEGDEKVTATIDGFQAEIDKFMSSALRTLTVTLTDADAEITLTQTSKGSEITEIVSRGAIMTPETAIVLDESPELSIFTVDGRITVFQVVCNNGAADKYAFVENRCYRNIESTKPRVENGEQSSERWFYDNGYIGTALISISDMIVKNYGYIEISYGNAVTHFTSTPQNPITFPEFLGIS